MPRAPSPSSACRTGSTACSALAGGSLLPPFLDPAQLHYLQATLATHLNNSVSSLNMQNTQRNLVSCCVLGFFLKNLELLRGLPLPLP